MGSGNSSGGRYDFLSMTEKLYYTEPYRTEFTSTLISHKTVETTEGTRWKVELAATCFYPAGGGQPSDRGTLNDREVTDVIKEDGRIFHLLDSPLEKSAHEILGRIEPMHRRHFMQQHTGQHIISAVLQKSGRRTRSVHLGEAETSVEVEGPVPVPFEIIQIEDEVNRIICSNLPVRGFFIDEDELQKHNLRRSLKTSGKIRIVEISGVDKIGCGGVHLEKTGEVRLIKHVRTETVRGNCRLSFLIGDAAVADYREKSRITARLTEILSTPQQELLKGLEDHLGKISEKDNLIRGMRKLINRQTAEKLLAEAEIRKDAHILSAELPADQADQLREIGDIITENPGRNYFALTARSGTDLRWIIGAPGDAPEFFNQTKSNLLPIINGKGGGRPPIWQGAGTYPQGSELFLRTFLELVHSRTG